ncbi:ABC transporter substrate-binding protein [Aquabacterium sp. J223]|uniref:ABC transporter substrate-binding protein n=1 Tax=Aquabacterium sp. J223 TaxID=2898431 RepID=UPI0021ADC497|nr:ABC transporter substrate-binding protein [Aquabacterium sp. J223]UUX94051.1 ABC transporter substrate-binding protein [Aquabacterium sp. J223]
MPDHRLRHESEETMNIPKTSKTTSRHSTPDAKRRTLLKSALLPAGAAVASLPLANIASAQSRTLKIGIVSPISGPAAAFGETAEFTHKAMQKLFAKGLTVGGKTYTVELLLRDGQSTVNRSTAVASELMTRERVDMLLSDAGETPIGAGQMANVNGTPFVSTMMPSDALLGVRGGPDAFSNKGKPWNFHFMFNAGDIGAVQQALWDNLLDKTNRKVGTWYVDAPASRGFADPQHGFSSTFKSRKLTEVPGGFFKLETDDFSNQVSLFKRENAEILNGFVFAPHFATFWRQAAQAGYKPNIVTMAGAFLFPSGLDALGDRGDGMSTEMFWSPRLPYTSSLTGQTPQQIANEWEQATGRQWTSVLGYAHAIYEAGFAALKASGDPKDKSAVQAALMKLKVDTVVGTLDWTGGDVKGLAKIPLAGGQWRKAKTGKFKYDLLVTHNKTAPNYPIEAETKLLTELT